MKQLSNHKNLKTKIISMLDIRNNLTELMAEVHYKHEVITVARNGKPFVIITSPEEFDDYQAYKMDKMMKSLRKIQAKNANMSEEEIAKIVEEEVMLARQESA